MRITRVYTRTGDDGTTGLADGTRLPKDDIRIEAYGTVDELNAVVGMVLDSLPAHANLNVKGLAVESLLQSIQHDLFNVGGDLATPVENRFQGMVLVSEREIRVLESLIDAMTAELPPLRDFILPAGSASCSALHLARTVCRRAERRAVHLAATCEINPFVIQYLNRLSDFFFVACRFVQLKQHLAEVVWSKQGGLAQYGDQTV
jgi:cob(I)alamin adenosyltransferase